MSNRGMLWTSEEIEQLKTEVNSGQMLSQIAVAHERTPYGIVGKMQTLGWLILRGTAYHLINPEPWALGSEVYNSQKEFLEGEKK